MPWFATLAYLASAGMMLGSIVLGLRGAAAAKLCRTLALTLGWMAVGLHAWGFYAHLKSADSLSVSFFNALSLSILAINAVLMASTISKPTEKLSVVIFPLAAAILALDHSFPISGRSLAIDNWQIDLHVITSLFAYAFLNLAAVQALMLALQDWQLKRRRHSSLVHALPPIQTMESLLFQLIWVGLGILSVSLVSGSLFVHDLREQHLAHKTVLSVVAWVIFAALLAGRTLFGWRGTVAIRWTLSGFFALALAYFGSKFVLEIVLHRL